MTTTSPVRDRATIQRTALGIYDHFCGFTWEWSVRYDGGGAQTIGGWALDDKPADGSHDRTPTAYGMAFIVALLAAAGVTQLEKLVGRPIVVVRDGHRGIAIGIEPVDGQPGTPFLFATSARLLPELVEATVRRVYRAQKRRYGRLAYLDGIWSPARNSARLATARICGLTVAQLKQVLALGAGPKTTRSPGERG